MVRITSVTLPQYQKLLSDAHTRSNQLYIVRTVMDALRARSITIIPFSYADKTYNILDILEDFGYRDAGHNFTRSILSADTPSVRRSLICSALAALAVYIQKNPLIAAGINGAFTLYAPQASTLSANAVRFIEVGVERKEFVQQIPSIRKTLVLLSQLFNKHPHLLRAKVRFTTGDSLMNQTLARRRGETFGMAWKSLVDFLNHFTADNKDQWNEELQQLIILGQKETDRYLAAQKLLLQLLNKAAGVPTMQESIVTLATGFAAEWPIQGSFVREGTLYLPLDMLDIDDVRAWKIAFGKKMRTVLESSKERVPKENRKDFNTVVNDMKLALDGTLEYEESRTRFWHAVLLLTRITPADGRKARDLAHSVGLEAVRG